MTEHLKIFFEQETIQTGTVKVSWKCSPELLQTLNERNIEKPYVLFSLKQDIKNLDFSIKEDRVLAQLSAGEVFIQLRRPGIHQMTAIVVFGSCVQGFLSKNYFTGLKVYDWKLYTYKRIFDEDSDHLNGFILNFKSTNPDNIDDLQIVFTQLEIDVPEGITAKEPANWEKAWVNLMLPYKAVDQCAFGKRRLFAYSVQPVIFLIWKLILFICALATCLLAGCTPRFKAIFCRIDTSWSDVFEGISHVSIFFFDRDWKFLGILMISITPKVLFVEIVPTALICKVSDVQNAWVVFSLFYGFVLTIFLIVGYFAEIRGFFKKDSQRKPRKKPFSYATNGLYDLLVTDPVNRTPDLKTHVPAMQRVKLRFYKTKAKVCRPFAD